MIIGLLGHKESGKTTIANYLIQYQFIKISFSDPLKQICKILFQFTDQQLYGNDKEIVDSTWNVSPRTIMQYIGTNIFRNQMGIIPNINDNFWVKLFELNVNQLNKSKNLVIDDIRFQNEIDKIIELKGIVIKITRPHNNFDNHISEVGIDNLSGSYEINNDGTLSDLYKKIDKIIAKLN